MVRQWSAKPRSPVQFRVPPPKMSHYTCRGGEIGRRKGLKILRAFVHAGSIPALGTSLRRKVRLPIEHEVRATPGLRPSK